jgi:hypothetical protein
MRTKAKLSEPEIKKRLRAVANGIANTEMEGLSVSVGFRQDARAWAYGLMNDETVIERIKARHFRPGGQARRPLADQSK